MARAVEAKGKMRTLRQRHAYVKPGPNQKRNKEQRCGVLQLRLTPNVRSFALEQAQKMGITLNEFLTAWLKNIISEDKKKLVKAGKWEAMVRAYERSHPKTKPPLH
jgi:hypothetical protein